MNNIESNDEFLQQVIDHNGVEKQIVIAIEELSELQKELCKYLRGKEDRGPIHEEMADVTIVLRELQLIFGNEECVNSWIDLKIAREHWRMNQS